MSMNDPHVKAILYLIDHDDSVDYREVAPLFFEDDLFHVKAERLEVIFEPKNHYATEAEARSTVEGLVRRWEFDASLRGRSSEFRHVYAGADVIDRNPPPLPPGVVNLGPITARAGIPKVQMSLTKVAASYPAHPQGPAIDPDDPNASVMRSRLDLYRQGRDPLGDVANFCLTVLEYSALQVAGGKGNKRKAAANYYQIERKVLDKVGELSSTKGGSAALKAEGRSDPFTQEETRFLVEAVTAFVRRVAEKAANPNGSLPLIAMADLPKPSDKVKI